MKDNSDVADRISGPGLAKDLEKTFPDTLSHKGALDLARRLQDYWHERGYAAVRFWAEPIGERFSKVGTYDLYRVACNLVNGNPPRYRE